MNENSETVKRLINLLRAADRAVVLARRERDAFPMGSDEHNAAAGRAVSRLHEFYSCIVNSPEFAVLSRDANA